MAENEFPKKGGDDLYASEVNNFSQSVTVAQLAYEQVKSDGSNWTNTDYLGADIFTDSNGVKDTVDTGNSTAQYRSDTDLWQLSDTGTEEETLLDNFNDESIDTDIWNTSTDDSVAGGSATATVDEGSTTANKLNMELTISNGGNTGEGAHARVTQTGGVDFRGRMGVVEFDWKAVKGTDGGDYLKARIYLNNVVIFEKTSSDNTAGSGWKLKFEPISNTSDSVTVYLDSGSGYESQGDIDIGSGEARLKAEMVFVSQGGVVEGGADGHIRLNNVWYSDYDSSSTVETNTIINEKVPDSIVVYGKTDLPTNTNITVDVSQDGGSTWDITGKDFNEYIDTSSFTGSDLALKFNLSTSDTSATPKLYGYGVTINH